MLANGLFTSTGVLWPFAATLSYYPEQVYFPWCWAATKGGATVLKVGGAISRAERAKKFFWPPPPYDYLGGTEINMVVLNLTKLG